MGIMGMCERKQEGEGDGWKRTESGKSLDEQIYQTHLPQEPRLFISSLLL